MNIHTPILRGIRQDYTEAFSKNLETGEAISKIKDKASRKEITTRCIEFLVCNITEDMEEAVIFLGDLAKGMTDNPKGFKKDVEIIKEFMINIKKEEKH